MPQSQQEKAQERTLFDLEGFQEQAFGPVSAAVRDGRLNADAALDMMREATLEGVPDCQWAFGHGSALQGSFSAFSDLDVVAVVPSGQFWEKRCLNHKGYLVELQIYSLDILDILLLLAKNTGMSFGLMASSGVVIIDIDGGAPAFKERLQVAFDEGPKPISGKAFAGFRHKLTNRIVELLGAGNPDERVACGLAMYDLIVKIELALSTGWRHTGKWVPRVLAGEDSETFPRINAAYQALLAGDAQPLASFAAALLDRIGGPLWRGYSKRQSLPTDMATAGAMIVAAQQLRD